MRMLAIECACPPGSVALLENGKVVAEQALDSPSKTTQQFACVIRDLLAVAHWSSQQIDIVTAHQGPGSFTGLRIGVTAAKVFAYAIGAKVVGVNTLETIATQVAEHASDGNRIEAIMDAQRGQLFTASFEVGGGIAQARRTTAISDFQEWSSSLQPGTQIAGPALKKIKEKISSDQQIVQEHLWYPSAITLGRLAARKVEFDANEPIELNPEYFRKSAAEEKAEKS